MASSKPVSGLALSCLVKLTLECGTQDTCLSQEAKSTTVELPDFWMGQTEVKSMHTNVSCRDSQSLA